MLSKNQIKLIRSLGQKKFRGELGLFVVEGIKGIKEFLNSNYVLEKLYTTDFIFNVGQEFCQQISESELKRISFLKSPNTALAIFKVPQSLPVNFDGLVIALDDVRDPGNLGTIIRLCDWYGVRDLVCSQNTVDCYNPKVVQASMGSLTRVNINYSNLSEFLLAQDIPAYGTFMEGYNIYKSELPAKAIVVFGNEANGISDKVKNLLNSTISIPRFGCNKVTESLNVSMATAIVLSEFKRRTIEM